MQSLVPTISLRTPDQRYLEKGRVGSGLSARWLPCCSGANYLHFYGGWHPSYCIPDDSSAFWELAETQMDFAVICWHQVGHAVFGAQ